MTELNSMCRAHDITCSFPQAHVQEMPLFSCAYQTFETIKMLLSHKIIDNKKNDHLQLMKAQYLEAILVVHE